MNIIQEYRSTNDAIKTSVDSLKNAEDMTYSVFKMKYGVTENACYLIGRMGEMHIAGLSEQQALSMLYPNGKTVDGTDPDLHEDMEIYNSSVEDENDKFDNYGAYLRHVVREIHDSYRDLMGVNESIRSLISQRDVMAESIMKAQDDPKYQEKKAEMLSKLDNEIENESDPYQKKKLVDLKDYQTSLDTCEYVFDRILHIDGEAENIIESFFDSTKNRYIMKKATDKFKQLGLGNASATLRRLGNIEEMFLDEKYAQFNNLFLFVAFRMVASARSDNERGYAKDLIVKLNRLVNHAFTTPEHEQEFLKVITDFEDLFLQNDEYREKFINENRTWSGCKNGTEKGGNFGRIDRVYYKNDFHPCGTDTKFTGSHLYSFILPNHAMTRPFAEGLKGDFETNSGAEVELFYPVVSAGSNTIMGYDRYKEYLDIMLTETKFDKNKVLILCDIAYPELELEDYQMYLMRSNLLAEKSGWVIINICGYSDDPAQTYEFKAPSLESIDKVESDTGFYFQRLRPCYSSSFSTVAVNIRSEKKDNETSEQIVDFMILNAKADTLSEPIYHTVFDGEEMTTIPHSIKYPEDIPDVKNEETSEEATKEEPEEEDETSIVEDSSDYEEEDETAPVEEAVESEEEDDSPLIVNDPDVHALAYQDESGEIHELPGMYAKVTGSVVVDDDDDMVIDTVKKADSEPET